MRHRPKFSSIRCLLLLILQLGVLLAIRKPTISVRLSKNQLSNNYIFPETVCSNKSDLNSLLTRMSSRVSPRATPTFFYESFPDPDLEQCIQDMTSNDSHGFDFGLWDEACQYSGDWFWRKHLENHPSRVSDPHEADFYILGFTPSLSKFIRNYYICGSISHYAYINSAASRLKKIKQLYPSSNFFFPSTGYPVPEILGNIGTIINLNPNNTVIGLSDDYYGFYLPRRFILPYKATKGLEAIEFNTDRTLLIFFAGGTIKAPGWYNSENRYRIILRRWENIADDIRIISDWDRNENFKSRADRYAKGISNSRYCLIPEGDTPTSRRLFDALAGGCIPVLLGRPGILQRALPFPTEIDWPSIILFAGSLKCLYDNEGAWNGTLKWLRKLPYDVNMAKRGFDLFRSRLSYIRPGIVDMTLIQAKIELERKEMKHKGWMWEGENYHKSTIIAPET